MGVSVLRKSSKILLCVYPLRRNQDPAPRLRYCFLTAPPLSLRPFPSLISNCLNLPFGTQGSPWRLKPIPYKQETWDTERLPCPGAPQGPAQFQVQEPSANLSHFRSVTLGDSNHESVIPSNALSKRTPSRGPLPISLDSMYDVYHVLW